MENRILMLACLVLFVVGVLSTSNGLDNSPNDDVTQDGVSRFEDLSVDAQQILYEAQRENGWRHVTGLPVPIYRKDLSPDYIAYWLAEFDDSHYVIMAAGPTTGDRKIARQGRLPSPLSRLQNIAEHHGNRCFRFYLLSNLGDMMCENDSGRIVATNMEERVLRNVSSSDPYSTQAEQFISSHLCDFRVEWARQAIRVRRTGQWEDEEIAADQSRDYMDDEDQEEDQEGDEDWNDLEDVGDFDAVDEIGTATESELAENPVYPGEPVKIALGSRKRFKDVYIKPVTSGEMGSANASANAKQDKLCSAVPICDGSSSDGLVSSSWIHTDPDTGLLYLEFDMPESPDTADSGSLDFAIHVHSRGSSALIRYYALKPDAARVKRYLEEGSDWSAWGNVVSIPDENRFPDYDQHDVDGCAVGCGPVAWAMVFGYLDRRSHYNPAVYGTGSQGLYRSGANGVTGDDSEVAPLSQDARLRGYTEHLNDVMDTWCVSSQGLTLMSSMGRVKDFYKGRQTSGTPRIREKGSWTSWLGIYRDFISRWTRVQIAEGWPVIVGYRLGLFSWHYPVATQYRSRTQTVRRCRRRRGYVTCGEWETSTEYQMYLHMGWGGREDGWQDMESFYATTATY